MTDQITREQAPARAKLAEAYEAALAETDASVAELFPDPAERAIAMRAVAAAIAGEIKHLRYQAVAP